MPDAGEPDWALCEKRLSLLTAVRTEISRSWLDGSDAARAHKLKLEGFSDGLGMRRYLLGAVLMGFGAMLAGGCAVGAGVTGASVFALTAWLVLGGMWLGAGLTDLLVDRAGMPRPRQAVGSRRV